MKKYIFILILEYIFYINYHLKNVKVMKKNQLTELKVRLLLN